MATIRLGQLLVDARMLSQQALDEVLALQKIDGRRIGTLLVERGYVNETQLTQILSHQLSVPWVALLHIEFSRQLLNLVPYEVAERFCLVPIYVRHVRGQGDTLYVAMDDPTNEDPLKECTKYSGLPVRAMIAPPSDIREAIRVCYGIEIEAPHSKAALAKQAAQTPAPPPTANGEPSSPPTTDASPTAPQLSIPPQTQTGDAQSGGDSDAPRTSRSGASTEPAPSGPLSNPQRASAPPPLPSASARIPSTLESAESPPPSTLPASTPSPSRRRPLDADADGPVVEAVEIALPRRKRSEPSDADEPGAPSERPVPSTRKPGRGPRMLALTLLDGTTLNLPTRPKPAPVTPDTLVSGDDPSTEDVMTARDLIAALRAVSRGADSAEVLGEHARWETLFAALLSLLFKKRVITEWEFIEELKKTGRDPGQ